MTELAFTPAVAAATEALRWISDAELAEKESICPADVPMRKIAQFVRNHA